MSIENIDPSQRIVVTGMGAVSPLGLDVQTSTDRIMNGEDGIVSIRDTVLEKYPKLRVSVAAQVLDFDMKQNKYLGDELDDKRLRRLHRSSQFALAASAEALQQAGLFNHWQVQDAEGYIDWSLVNMHRVGVSIGSGVGGADIVGETRLRLDNNSRIPPSDLFQMLPERVASTVSMILKARGPLKSVVAACATGNANIIEAARLLKLGEADVMIAGGAEAQILVEGIGLFEGTNALDQSEYPSQASRPFHEDAKGFVMGEGAGILILESLKHARNRGAEAIAELIGYGETADAYHETFPSGEGAVRALKLALDNLSVRQNIYVNAHATGTGGDAIELESIGAVLDPSEVTAISSTKGATGHMLGAASAFESIVAIEAMLRGLPPPTLKLDKPIEATKSWNMSPFKATPARIDAVVNNSFGFGGINGITVYAPLRD